jgi:SOS-response transcriptional repressor LexA
MTGPTVRQRAILNFIVEHRAAVGYSPTVREIAARFAIRSTTGVIDHLRSLERKGLLRRGVGRSRGLVPLGLATPSSKPRGGVESLREGLQDLEVDVAADDREAVLDLLTDLQTQINARINRLARTGR